MYDIKYVIAFIYYYSKLNSNINIEFNGKSIISMNSKCKLNLYVYKFEII